VPSAKRTPQLAVLALCGAIGAGVLTGCETTQEKAAAQRAESARILSARAKRQAKRRHHKHHADGAKSSHRQKGEG
jgi:regulator of protease activity HflC (stomatin/prohibitin superfamily)